MGTYTGRSESGSAGFLLRGAKSRLCDGDRQAAWDRSGRSSIARAARPTDWLVLRSTVRSRAGRARYSELTIYCKHHLNRGSSLFAPSINIDFEKLQQAEEETSAATTKRRAAPKGARAKVAGSSTPDSSAGAKGS